MESFENTKKFSSNNIDYLGLMTKIGEEELDIMYKHFGYRGNYKSIPEIVYEWFDNHKKFIDKERLFFMKYPSDFYKHDLYVQKKIRRENFGHVKQVKINDPYYLKNQKGIMVIQ